jgi:hypothetical protein
VKLQVKFQIGDVKVDEIVEGDTAEAIVTTMQKRVAAKANFLVATVIKGMTPLQFAQEAMRRYNTSAKDNAPIPATCDEFIQNGIARQFATVLEE